MYMMTSDENIKVDIKEPKEPREESFENDGSAIKNVLNDAFSRIKNSSPKKSPRVSAPEPGERGENKTLEPPRTPDNSENNAGNSENSGAGFESAENAEVTEYENSAFGE
jgi:hypothetical protein